jgi:hypothetical protein
MVTFFPERLGWDAEIFQALQNNLRGYGLTGASKMREGVGRYWPDLPGGHGKENTTIRTDKVGAGGKRPFRVPHGRLQLVVLRNHYPTDAGPK